VWAKILRCLLDSAACKVGRRYVSIKPAIRNGLFMRFAITYDAELIVAVHRLPICLPVCLLIRAPPASASSGVGVASETIMRARRTAVRRAETRGIVVRVFEVMSGIIFEVTTVPEAEGEVLWNCRGPLRSSYSANLVNATRVPHVAGLL
jgi:hypothetical protein